jgi:hypothetical protein
VKQAGLGEVIWQGARERPHDLIAPIVEGFDRLDIDLQGVAFSRAFDGDRAGADMSLDRGRHLRMDGGELGGNDEGWRRH